MNKKDIKEDAYKNLGIINEWINNSDSKTSISLGLFGILLTIIFTNNNLINKFNSLMLSVFKNIDFSDVLYFIILMFFITLSVFGLWYLIKVLIPTLKMKLCGTKSFLYFGSIAQYSGFKEYKDDILKASEDDVIDDLLNQVYQNSIICNKKYKNFTTGIKLFLIGFIGFVIMYNLGILIYL